MKKILIFIIISVVFTTKIFAQQKNNDGFQVFWDKFKKALIKNDKATIVKLTQFPVNYADENIMDTTIGSKMFLKMYNKFFHKEALKALLIEKPKKVYDDGHVIPDYYVIHVGVYDHYSFGKRKGEWKFIGIIGND